MTPPQRPIRLSFMRVKRERQTGLSLRVTDEMRRVVERLAAHLTLKTGRRHTLTDVIEEAIRRLAKKHCPRE